MIPTKLNFATRLVLVVVGIEIIMLTILVWNSVRLINSSHAELFERTVVEETLLLSDSLSSGLAYRDRAILLDALSLLKDKENLVYAEVLDRTGLVMASIGQAPVDPTPDQNYQQALNDGIFDVTHQVKLSNQFLGTLNVGFSISEIQKITDETRFQNTSIAVIELILSITVTIILGLYLMRRINTLKQGALALKNGLLYHRIPMLKNDEIGELALTFNQLAEHLDNTQAELKREHEALEQKTRHLQTLLNGIDAIVFEADAKTMNFMFVSAEATSLLGYPLSAWSRNGFWLEIIYPDDLNSTLTQLQKLYLPDSRCSMDYRVRSSSGQLLWLRHIASIEPDGDNLIARGLLLDISEEKKAAKHISYLASHDSLTNLFNRRKCLEEIQIQVDLACRYQHQSALLFIDLDQFKYINDTFGHLAGDECLIQVSQTLKSSVRSSDILSRLGGDEFAIIMPIVKKNEAEAFAQQLLQRLSSQRICYGEQCSYISASVGLVIFPLHGTQPSELLAKADVAMYNAKNQGRNRFHIFKDDGSDAEFMEEKVHWVNEIKNALSDNRFKLFFQPIIDIASNTISHYEVLVRMVSKSGEIIPPSQFIETAERFGLIYEIDKWVIKNAIEAQNSLPESNEVPSIAINLSGRHFGSDECFQLVNQMIHKYNVKPEKLIFEVTETVALENFDQARDFINSLRNLGCRFALDDFGVGFASFQYLKSLPVDFIKIDGNFIRELHIEAQDQVFVKAIWTVANSLGICTIAEYVENEEILNELKDVGVEMGQGFYWSEPQELEDCIESIAI